MEFLLALVTAFVLVVPIELPDKTFVATLVLATRYNPLPVWIGVTVAFGVQSMVAVLAGRLVGLLPQRPVHLVAAGLFGVGAVVLARSARRAQAEEREREEEFERRLGYAKRSGVRAVMASFAVLFVAEWGDLSQLLTAGLAARYHDPVSVFVGSLLALIAVAGLAVVLGRTLLRFVKLSTIRRVGAAVCLLLALVAAYDVIRSLT
jgi:putative Ca2+/H+ antiporter (TMEM165/GDT1 family)